MVINLLKLSNGVRQYFVHDIVKTMTRRRNRNSQPKLKNRQIETGSITYTATPGDWFGESTIISNEDNLTSGKTGYVETVGNFSIDCTYTSDGALRNTAVFIMYIPESYDVTSSTPAKHPEWIMAYKYLGCPTSFRDQGMQPIRIRSRVRRTLMTGDKIVMFVQGTNPSTTVSQDLKVDYLLKFASRIN